MLLVDDDAEVRTALADLLTVRGFEVDVAQNALDAIDSFERGARPDVVLADLCMPGLIGSELIEYMHGRSDLAEIPLAIVSGHPQLAPRGYKVFLKPVDGDVLVQFLRATHSDRKGDSPARR